jgi:hypothetical protein
MNTHHYAQTLQKVLQGAEPHMGAEWTIRCVKNALDLEAARYERAGNYNRAAQFAAAAVALDNLRDDQSKS